MRQKVPRPSQRPRHRACWACGSQTGPSAPRPTPSTSSGPKPSTVFPSGPRHTCPLLGRGVGDVQLRPSPGGLPEQEVRSRLPAKPSCSHSPAPAGTRGSALTQAGLASSGSCPPPPFVLPSPVVTSAPAPSPPGSPPPRQPCTASARTVESQRQPRAEPVSVGRGSQASQCRADPKRRRGLSLQGTRSLACLCPSIPQPLMGRSCHHGGHGTVGDEDPEHRPHLPGPRAPRVPLVVTGAGGVRENRRVPPGSSFSDANGGLKSARAGAGMSCACQLCSS